jgi:hypothetical protein
MWAKIKTALRHNQFLVTALVMSAILVVWVYGCDSKTASPWNSEVKVTRLELDTLVETKNLEIKAAYADIDKQDLFKKEFVSIGVAFAEAGGVSPVGVGVGVMLLGILGLTVDNRKKDSLITLLRNTGGTANGTTSSTATA